MAQRASDQLRSIFFRRVVECPVAQRASDQLRNIFCRLAVNGTAAGRANDQFHYIFYRRAVRGPAAQRACLTFGGSRQGPPGVSIQKFLGPKGRQKETER